MSPYDQGRNNPFGAVPHEFNVSARLEYERGQRDGMPTEPDPDAGKGIVAFFEFIFEFIKAPPFEKLVWLLLIAISFNGCAVGLTNFHKQGNQGFERFGYLMLAGLVLFFVFRRSRHRVIVFALAVLSVVIWDYKIIADDVKKNNELRARGY
ncbi:hypothetical protein J0X19_11910 [Hymenobacter sp. BT186]|uniref:Uncharacterized protein n=1 Tax=Hymenobacter telluris TaxID=2816474 RepID=A0A939EWF0_9BACT|nr:hypothetical protein [Hymenobacter telluris]MBO0358653.1 hypothetical protein [Hymenobacter telluris]MBW3374679.1 hypothetical protein [Hymenobacter norwichensis]